MKVLRPYRLLRFSLVLSAILAQCVALSSIPVLVVSGTLAALSWYVTEGPRGKSIPAWFSRFLVLAVFVYCLFDAIALESQLPEVLGRFVVWLTVIKLYGKRTVENEAQLLLLSLLLFAVGALYATGLLFGVLLVVWTGLAAWVLLLYQLHQGMETMRSERYEAVPVEYPTPWTRPVSGLHVRKTFCRCATILLLLGLFGSAFFFVVVPRKVAVVSIEQSMAMDDQLERMELKPDQDIQLSNKKIMTVSLQNNSGESVRLPQGLRLRGAALNEYQGQGVWETGLHFKSSIETVSDQFTPLSVTGNRTDVLVMDVSLYQPMSKVYSIYRPIGIETDPPTTVTTNLANATMGLVLGSTPLLGYRVQVDLEDTIISPYSQKQNQYQNEEVYALALEILKNNSIAKDEIPSSFEARRRAARAFELFLHSSEFTYSTSSSGVPILRKAAMLRADDPTAEFLLRMKSGHCEFFAAAMVALCDTVNIPSRIVTGYYADRWDASTKSYVVLGRDAHAWVEVETEPLAWETFDPTPSSVGSPIVQEPMTFAQNIRMNWDYLNSAWQEYVFGYDSSMQNRLVSGANPYWRDHLKTVVNLFKTTGSRVSGWFDIGAGGRLWIDLVMGATILSGVALLILRWRRKRTTQLLRFSQQVEEGVAVVNVEFYAQLQRVFARQGIVRPAHIPAMTWVHSLHLSVESDTIATSLSSTYYEIRYGSYCPSRSERIALMQQVQQLAMMLRKELR